MLDFLKRGRLASVETAEGLPVGDQTAAILDLIYQRMVGSQGLTPQLFIREFDLTAAGGATVRQTIRSDFRPDRWTIWMRAVADATIRILLGDNVPAAGEAIELAQGQFVVIGIPHNPEGSPMNTISFLSTGTGAPHVFAVATSGGTDFEIGTLI